MAAYRLDDLPGDVLYRIVRELATLKSKTSFIKYPVKSLSCTSWRMRSHCMSVLFRRCHTTWPWPEPPHVIRPFVRAIVYNIEPDTVILRPCAPGEGDLSGPAPTSWYPCYPYEFIPDLGVDLRHYPAAKSVAFHRIPGGVPCQNAIWTSAPPPTLSDYLLRPCRLTELSYTPPQERDVAGIVWGKDPPPPFALESSWLRALVLAMSDTAESLTLPVETAPLLEMAAKDWPRLHTLVLVGHYTHPDQCRTISLLLSRTPDLRSLSIDTAQRPGIERPQLLQRPPRGDVLRLRSLSVAYPNPDDPIFSCLGDCLESLSLRDSPRHVFRSRVGFGAGEIYPILTSSECLAILRRVPGRGLTKLELVYQADAAEDELLLYLSQTFPLLQDLELHRYGASPIQGEEDVPCRHIAGLLIQSVKYLRALYLNLDIWDDSSPPWVPFEECRDVYEEARVRRGRQLVEILQAGAYFEYVALYLAAPYVGDWVMFHPAWSPNGPVDAHSRYALDSYPFRQDGDGF